MPQVFDAVCCGQCSTFQVQCRGATKKNWSCVLCGAKQSYIRIYATGPAKDLRPIVQQLNASRGSVPEFSAAQDARRAAASDAPPQPEQYDEAEFACAFGGASSAPSSHPLSCEPEERRIDVNDPDAGAFTRAVFFEFYGSAAGSFEWDRAQPQPGANANIENCWQQRQHQQHQHQQHQHQHQHQRAMASREPDCSHHDDEEEGDVYVTSLPGRRGGQKRPKRAHEGAGGQQDVRGRQRVGDGPSRAHHGELQEHGSYGAAPHHQPTPPGHLREPHYSQQPRMAQPVVAAAAAEEEEEDEGLYQTRAEVFEVEEEVWQG